MRTQAKYFQQAAKEAGSEVRMSITLFFMLRISMPSVPLFYSIYMYLYA